MKAEHEKRRHPHTCPVCDAFPCRCPAGSGGGDGDSQDTAEQTNPYSSTNEVIVNNPHAILYVWLGGPVPELLREKMALLKKEDHEIYLFHDLEDTPAARDSLVATKTIGVNLIQFTEQLSQSILSEHGFKDKERNILWQAYQHQYYGHSLGASVPPSAVCRNFAAAADILRLIGLIMVEKIAPPQIHHCLYSDYDAMPLPRMMHPGSDYGLQLHQFRGKYSLVGQGDVENPGLGLNNAMIRLRRGKKEFELIFKSLGLIVERYTAFFKLTAEDQQRCTHKLSGWVRVMMTLFLGGPHIFETLKWQQPSEKNFSWSFLYDCAENESEADFENASTRAWSAPYQPSFYSEEALLYLLSSMVQGLFKDYKAYRNTLKFSDKPRSELGEILHSMGFPEATITKLSKTTHDLDTFLFRDLEEAKQFVTQNPDNPFFQLADIGNEASRKALFAKWVSVQPILDEIRKIAENDLLETDTVLAATMLRVNELDIEQQKLVFLIGIPLENKLFFARCLCHPAGEEFLIRHLDLIDKPKGPSKLLNRGASLEAEDEKKRTPLMLAIEHSQKGTVIAGEKLLKLLQQRRVLEQRRGGAVGFFKPPSLQRQLEAEHRLKDTTPVDPYEPGIIVPYRKP